MIAAKILVVEDESVVAWHVQEALQKLGHEVVAIAQTAKEAIQFAAHKCPDLVLMDICLQGQTDGVLAAEHLYLNLDLPVVYLTAHADEHTLRRATETSPFGYLIKPFQEAELHSTIQIALRRHQLERALKATQQWYATTLVSIGDATIATDVDGFVMFMNPTAELLTGHRSRHSANLQDESSVASTKRQEPQSTTHCWLLYVRAMRLRFPNERHCDRETITIVLYRVVLPLFEIDPVRLLAEFWCFRI